MIPLLVVFLCAALVNLVAAFGPELGFDALWYHLTIPKIYLMWGKIDFIPGGLLYYSALPRLGELLYLVGDRGAHLINWMAGIGAALMTYKLGRIYLNKTYAFLAAIIFYCTPLVGWQSGSAYVDLLRTFFEISALYFVLTKKNFFGGIAIGLAISTKTLALGSLGILGFLNRFNLKFIIPAVLISFPWFVWAYLKTGYPFYPIGARILDASHNIGNIWPLVPLDWWLIIYPLTFYWWDKKSLLFKYAVLAFIVWFITPHTGEARFLLPYLPAFAVLSAQAINRKKILIFIALGLAIFSIFYRGAANSRLLPYLLGRETKEEYLCKRLEFSTQVFVDCDGWFKNNLSGKDLVLISGFHNLYYVNFPFVHETWYKGEKVNYHLTYRQILDLPLVYKNDQTGAYLYKVL